MDSQITSAFIDLALAMTSFIGVLIVAEIRKRLAGHTISLATDIATIAVRAAEQMGAAAGFNGHDKLDQALHFARDFARKHGIKLSDAQWENLIEAEVARLKAFGDELTAPAPSDAPDAPTAPEGPTANELATAALQAALAQLAPAEPLATPTP